jgi:phosphoribosyl 1,2-cyclic phosphodiesterase
MQLKVINSNSAGNCYILENEEEALILELGVRFERVKQELNFNLGKVVGAIVTHDHGDHSKGIAEALKNGIDVWSSKGTHVAVGTLNRLGAKVMNAGSSIRLGNFRIMAFKVKHDAAEPFGFLISHPETGTVLFLTDAMYSEYVFPGLNNIIIEANYCDSLIKDPRFLRDRVIQSHMSLQTCIKTLKANDLSQVNNIVLIHLSDRNSDEARFKSEVERATGKLVHVADKGVVVNLHLGF